MSLGSTGRGFCVSALVFTQGGQTVLITAAFEANVELAGLLLACGADLEAKDEVRRCGCAGCVAFLCRPLSPPRRTMQCLVVERAGRGLRRKDCNARALRRVAEAA